MLTLIGRVSKFINPYLVITAFHNWFMIEFKTGLDKHLDLENSDNIQDPFKNVPGIMKCHNDHRFNVLLTE